VRFQDVLLLAVFLIDDLLQLVEDTDVLVQGDGVAFLRNRQYLRLLAGLLRNLLPLEDALLRGLPSSTGSFPPPS